MTMEIAAMAILAVVMSCLALVVGGFKLHLDAMKKELHDIRRKVVGSHIEGDLTGVIAETHTAVCRGFQGVVDQLVVLNRKLESLVSEVRR